MKKNQNSLKKILGKFGNQTVGVLGDFMLDELLRGEATRISPEAPVPVVLMDGHPEPQRFPGGAGNVAINIRALGGRSVPFGAIGIDESGDRLCQELKARGVQCGTLARERDRIHAQIMTKGWNEQMGAFVQYEGGEVLDAALVHMPLVGFIVPNDPRWQSTMAAMDRTLVDDSLVYRYDLREAAADGLAGNEGTFNICTFWMVEALTRAGRVNPWRLDQARLVFEKMLGFANHLGLYSEETGSCGEALGNFPQALTHLGLISAAFNLNRALGGKDSLRA